MANSAKNSDVDTLTLRDHQGSDRRPVYTVCLAILLLTSVAINVLLTRELREHRIVIEQLKSEGRMMLEARLGGQLEIGQTIPKIEIQDRDGVKVALDHVLSDNPTVLYVFSPSCQWCTRNLENIKALADGIKERHRLIGLSVIDSGLQEYIFQNGLPFPVYTIVPTGAGSLISRTPRTLVVSREGKVIANWVGAYGNEVRSNLEQYFQLTLPGIERDESGSPEPGRFDCDGNSKQ